MAGIASSSSSASNFSKAGADAKTLPFCTGRWRVPIVVGTPRALRGLHYAIGQLAPA